MRTGLLGLLSLLIAAAPALALDNSTVQQLKRLDPEEELEQRCDIEAMEHIKKVGDYRPDKVIAYTFSETKVSGTTIQAPGAVFRSRGEWYRLKYKCSTGPKRLEVTNFKLKIGSMVPRSDWVRYYLYD
ncbi:DUF930 domain-containing protein [Rhizobium halophytocola]|uniref:DUF930 domain-containing protein n=1 Tax=Rhizobium halophytocola TaxID=735519 RepID=A0ABS4DWT6_9HYPH|nr:DUF930 domain-containing protein [Rhizobium halophytocola]MBP1850157.1 hypothetical protein [Rhizobium halophytocola]